MKPDLEREHLQGLRAVLETRQAMRGSLRAFFEEKGFIEVETPVRVLAPAPERHIDPEPSGSHYLRTSPELHMKRILAAGYERIFQLGPCFRKGEWGARHHPEYSMLEWYRAGADAVDILADTKALTVRLARDVLGRTDLTYQGQPIELWPDWERITVADAFLQFAGWNPITDFDADRFDLDLVGKVEPRLPRDRPVLLADYPVETAALARRRGTTPDVAERWELYLGGLEIANAYTELTDPAEHRARFAEWTRLRNDSGKSTPPLDEAFLAALDAGLPPAGGIAMGVDRLLMLFCDAPSLDQVLPFRE